MTRTEPRCAISARCRQPLTLQVTDFSWTSLVCEKHAGLLLTRLLQARMAGVELPAITVTAARGALPEPGPAEDAAPVVPL